MTTTQHAGSSPTTVIADLHPRYPGSPPFADTEIGQLLFEGRTDEATEVTNRILSSDLLVVYGISGTGKTSLLQAGVFERLRGDDLWPVVVRMNALGTNPVELIGARLVEQAALDGLEILPPEPTATDLWDLLVEVEVWRGDVLQTPVIVFDQFEELFTLGWSRRIRDDFITQFGWVARGHRPVEQGVDSGPPPRTKSVILIREDSLGELEALARDVPHIMRNRFRLTPLDLRQAERAIRGPAAIVDERLASPPFEYADDAVALMLDFLRTREERGQKVKTDNVEPSQLQIICQHVEDEIVQHRGDVVVTAADLGGADGLNAILQDFYRRILESFTDDERARVSELCETGLINPSGRRLSLQVEEIERAYAVGRGTLDELVRQRLLRSEYRTGSDYFELAHDSLVAPILNYRDDRAREAAEARSRTIRRAVTSVAVVLILGFAGWALVQTFLISGGSTADNELADGAVSGTVTSRDGAVEGVTVAFHRAEEGADADDFVASVPGGDSAIRTITEADGTFIASVPPGTYRVQFQSPVAANGNAQYLEQWYDGSDGFSDAANVVVVEGESPDAVDVRLVRTGGITFTVHAGQDPPPVRVSLSGGTIDESDPPTPSIDGEDYEYADLGPGDYTLVVEADGFVALERTQPLDSAVAALGDLTLISESPLAATFVMRINGSDVADLLPGEEAEISYVVFNNGTEPITVAAIEGELGGAVALANPVIESGDGTTFSHPVGVISSMTSCPDLTSTSSTVRLRSDGDRSGESLVATAQYCELLPATIRVQMLVLSNTLTDTPEGVPVTLTRSDQVTVERTTDSSGVAEFEATVGSYVVTVGQPADTEFQSVTVDGEDQPVGSSVELEIPVRPESAVDVTFDLEALEFQITGTALADGAPVAGATVEVRNRDRSLVWVTDTGADGSFTFSAIDGTYEVTATSVGDGSIPPLTGESTVVVAGADVDANIEMAASLPAD